MYLNNEGRKTDKESNTEQETCESALKVFSYNSTYMYIKGIIKGIYTAKCA